MTARQQNKMAMYLAVKAVLDANYSFWHESPAFADGYTVLSAQIGLIRTLAQNQHLDIIGVMPKPRQTNVISKTVKQQLCDAFNSADEVLHEDLDNLIGQSPDAGPKFKKDYQSARTISDTLARHASPTTTATMQPPPVGLEPAKH